MATWQQFTEQAPDLAAAVRARIEAHKHLLIATLRRDGAPRISGNEAILTAGELWLGMMTDSVKGADLRRDPRFALHAAPIDLELAEGDAKLSGRALLVTDPADEAPVRAHLIEQGYPDNDEPWDLFRVDLRDASLVRVEGDELVIDSWRAGEPPRRRRRK